MNTPLGTTATRVAEPVTRPSTHPAATRWFVIALALGITLAGVLPVQAQEEEVAPEPALKAPLAAQALALGGVAVGDKLVGVGERGHILISADGGSTWTQADVPTRASLTSVFFHDDQLGWAVGHDSVILRTTDGGTTWEIVNWAPEEEAPFFDVWFADADNGIAIGAYGSYYETTDGGLTWSSRWISEDDWHLHKIAIAENGNLYIAAEAGSIYRSDDGGENWVTLPSLYEGSYFGILTLEDDVILVFGLRGHLFRSEDGGENWEEIDTGTVALLTDGCRMADGTIVIVGLGGAVLTSTDDGRTFNLFPQANRRGISSVAESTAGVVLLTGEFGVKNVPLTELTAVAD